MPLTSSKLFSSKISSSFTSTSTLLAAVHSRSLVLHRQWMLQFESYSSPMELMCQALLVCRFQQTRAENTMYLDGTANVPFREFKKFHPSCSSWLDIPLCAPQ
jgi:hypothetical protein